MPPDAHPTQPAPSAPRFPLLCARPRPAAQVAKRALAVSQPMLSAGDFMYEEGEGLEDDEVAFYGTLLPVSEAAPGGAEGTGWSGVGGLLLLRPSRV